MYILGKLKIYITRDSFDVYFEMLGTLKANIKNYA